MKLYKIFEDIILEEKRKLLTENVSEQEVIAAIDGRYNVNILYDDYPDAVPSVAPSKRYIQVYNLAQTKSGNKAIRAYQIFGGSKTTPKNGAWKVFRLDRIRGWFPTKVKFARAIDTKSQDIPTYRAGQENPKSPLTNVTNWVKFNNEPELNI